MFDFKHYVPILRWKAAEKDALVKLSPEEKKMITPVIELLMPQPDTKIHDSKDQLSSSISEFTEALPEIPGQILKYWGTNPIFIDVRLIDGSVRAQTLERVLDLGKSMDLFMIPVINIVPIVDFESDQKTRSVATDFAKVSGNGLCLRLSRSDLGSASLPASISDFLAKTGLPENQIDLLADFEIVDGNRQELDSALGLIPNLSGWRTFTLAGGSFPPDLTGFKVGGPYRTERFEWNHWLQQLSSNELTRKPAFADYSVLHPIYREPVRGATPSASIRYTLKDKWLIMRGQKKKSAQYLANAQLLSQQNDFSGENFSYGDGYITEKGKDITSPKTGSARTWLTAAINHHLALTVSQLANLDEIAKHS